MPQETPEALLWALLAVALAAPIATTAVLWMLRKAHEILFED